MLADYGPCGLTSLFLVCRLRDVPVDWEHVKNLLGPAGSDGTHSFADISRAATLLGLHPVGLRANRDVLSQLPTPAILQVWDPRFPDRPPHLLVLLRSEKDGAHLLDPPYQPYFLPETRFVRSYTGNVLVFAGTEQEARQLADRDWGTSAARAALWIWLGAGLALGALYLGSHSGRRILRRIPRTRRRSRLVAAVFGTCFAAIVGYLAFSKTPEPRCVFDTPVHELGEVSPGQLDYDVAIQNKGQIPLRVSGGTSSCTCASIKLPDVIEPGQTGVLRVRLSVVPGPQNAVIRLETNDPDGPKTVVLSWHGTAQPQLVPYAIFADGVPNRSPYRRVIHVVYPGGRSAWSPKLVHCDCGSPMVKVRAGRNDPMSNQFASAGRVTRVLGQQEVHVEVDPLPRAGVVATYCTLEYKYGKETVKLRLPVTVAFVDAEVRTDVDTLVFSAAHREDLLGQERSTRVTHPRLSPDLLLSGLPSWMTGELVRVTDDSSRLLLRIAAPPPTVLARETVYVHGSAVQRPIRVNVYATGE